MRPGLLYQRLVIAGWGHSKTSLFYIVWAVSCGIAGWAMAKAMPSSGLIGAAWAVWSGVMMWRLVLGVEAGAGAQ